MYIRTKDGRILDFDKLNEVSKLSIDMAEEPIREADTIEELCDCFVKVWCNVEVNPEVLIYNEQYEEEKENILLVYPKGNIIIYGAIWTDKGLIYVAKMDENGEWELI